MHATHGGYRAGSFVDGGWWKLRISDVQPSDELPRDIRHTTGYYINEWCDETYRPIVIRLPHGRLMAGYTMGEGMVTAFDTSEVFTDERRAWVRAHAIAEWDAREERDSQVSLCAECHNNEKRDSGELPDLCESCYADSPERTLAHHGWE